MQAVLTTASFAVLNSVCPAGWEKEGRNSKIYERDTKVSVKLFNERVFIKKASFSKNI